MPVKFHRKERQKTVQKVQQKEVQGEVDETIAELKDPPPPLYDEDGWPIDYDLDSDFLPPLPPPPLDLLGLDLI